MGALLTMTEVAAYLRVRREDVERMIAEDGLPVIELPGKTRLVRKFSAMALHEWIKGRSRGTPVPLEAFLREIEGCRSGDGETERRVA